MKERPVLFNGDMVRAILEGRKTQTRRVMKPQPDIVQHGIIGPLNGSGNLLVCRHGEAGDRLWVRETFRIARPNDPFSYGAVYRADKVKSMGMDEYSDRHKWTPSIHMPRWASRITLEITGVRVERLQDISSDDANKEGIQNWIESHNGGEFYHPNGQLQAWPVTAFARLWESIYKNWDSNPWVWVIEFKRVDA